MKYFRTYPWGLQLLLFLTMALTLSFGAVVIIGNLTFKLAGITLSQLSGIGPDSPAFIIKAAIIVQGISSVFVWLLPPLLFAYLAHPKPAQYLGLKAPGKMLQPLLAILVMLGAMPVLEMISGLISHINLGPSIKLNQQANENMTNAFLNIPTFTIFIKAFVILSIIPAVGEEMFFRGVLMRFAKKKSNNMVFPVIFTAAIFAFAHFNVYGFISLFLAGILLAIIYNLTGSLWCSILAHLFFNGSQVILSYASKKSPELNAYMENVNVPSYLVVSGLILFCLSFYLLLKNKTPLPPDWANDFKDLAPAITEERTETE